MTAAEETLEERNSRIVIDMWQKVIREGSREAVLRYIAPGYIQHNVNMPSGREHLLRLGDRTDCSVKLWEKTYTGHAFDMFRLEDGMIVEHWDDTRKWPKPW